MAEQNGTLEGWFVLELMGHRKLAGMVQEVNIAGAGFLRIDVPGGDGIAATQFYPPSSVYCISPVTEEVARAFALRNQPQPVTRYELPLAALTAREREERTVDTGGYDNYGEFDHDDD